VDPTFYETFIQDISITNLLIYYGIAFKKPEFYTPFLKNGMFSCSRITEDYPISYYDWICFFETNHRVQEKIKEFLTKEIKERRISMGYTILMHLSCDFNMLSIVKLIVENNLNDVNECDAFGNTALDWSHVYCCKGIIEYLTPKTTFCDPQKLKEFKFKEQDSETIIGSIKNNGLSLEYALDYFKDDPEVVFLAVNQNGLALEFASEKLKDEESIVRVAVNNNVDSLKFASKRLQ
jgi:hypothetical protein